MLQGHLRNGFLVISFDKIKLKEIDQVIIKVFIHVSVYAVTANRLCLKGVVVVFDLEVHVEVESIAGGIDL